MQRGFGVEGENRGVAVERFRRFLLPRVRPPCYEVWGLGVGTRIQGLHGAQGFSCLVQCPLVLGFGSDDQGFGSQGVPHESTQAKRIKPFLKGLYGNEDM
jgi:hypothetical protein